MSTEIYVVWHAADGTVATKNIIGVYSNERAAQDRVDRARRLPSLAEYPNEFGISLYWLDADMDALVGSAVSP